MLLVSQLQLTRDMCGQKKGKKKSNKTITISILKPIASGLTKENFIQILEKNIYSELDVIN